MLPQKVPDGNRIETANFSYNYLAFLLDKCTCLCITLWEVFKNRIILGTKSGHDGQNSKQNCRLAPIGHLCYNRNTFLARHQ
jgi:hypothetical protein